ncbi:hypothetical protein BpHYR1_010510 [Brachionus plicatilis]|uniref:Uncharacterized protein n=1 Tax=Brachionus plicatilis TaxID=10195 RepID=A0A3M7SIV6_BRAPC|nr:hypothetical protein BpHYR1_010510 [Brachionus plicatilis]
MFTLFIPKMLFTKHLNPVPRQICNQFIKNDFGVKLRSHLRTCLKEIFNDHTLCVQKLGMVWLITD